MFWQFLGTYFVQYFSLNIYLQILFAIFVHTFCSELLLTISIKNIITCHPTAHPQDYQGGDTKRDEGGLIKVKRQVDLKIHFKYGGEAIWFGQGQC